MGLEIIWSDIVFHNRSIVISQFFLMMLAYPWHDIFVLDRLTVIRELISVSRKAPLDSGIVAGLHTQFLWDDVPASESESSLSFRLNLML
jgi:hypothetical protein